MRARSAFAAMALVALASSCRGKQTDKTPARSEAKCVATNAAVQPIALPGPMSATGCTQAEARNALIESMERFCVGSGGDPMCAGTCGGGTDELGQTTEPTGQCRTVASGSAADLDCELVLSELCPPAPSSVETGVGLNAWACTARNVNVTCGCDCVPVGTTGGSLSSSAESAVTTVDTEPDCAAQRGAQSMSLQGGVVGIGCTREQALAQLQSTYERTCTGPSDPVCGGRCDRGSCEIAVQATTPDPPECRRATVSGCDGAPADTATPGPSAPSSPTPDPEPSVGEAETCVASNPAPEPFMLMGRIVTVACDRSAAEAALTGRIQQVACQGPSDPLCRPVNCTAGCTTTTHVTDGTRGCFEAYSAGCGASGPDPAHPELLLPNAWVCQAMGIAGSCGCDCTAAAPTPVPPPPPNPPTTDDGNDEADEGFNGWTCFVDRVSGSCACGCR